MIINDFNITRAKRLRRPSEADTPAVINPYAVLPFAVAVQGFKPVAWQEPQGFQAIGGIKDSEPFFSLPPNG
jgi:hypothetical protein